MKYLLLVMLSVSILAVGCNNTKIQGEIPSSPIESYQPLPK